MPEISIIVPVYNAAPYLERCVDSVLAQSFSDFELILVNDGSMDESAQIIDCYAAADPRIVAVHQPNSGASASRNAGLRRAKGRWIAFIDSDDYVMPGYLADMYTMAINDDCDLVVTGSTSGNGKYNTYPDVLVDREHIPELISKYKMHVCCPVWAKLFRASIIKDRVWFSESSQVFEDIMFVWEYLSLCSSVRLSSKVNYFYVLMPNSSSKFVTTYDREIAAFDYAKRVLGALKARFGKDFAVRYFNLQNYLYRVAQSVHNGDYSYLQRIRMLSRVQFDKEDLDYETSGRYEPIYKFLLRNRLWFISDIVTKSVVRKMRIRFKHD